MCAIVDRLGRRPFQWTVLASLQFMVLTALAMFLYPGGSQADHSSPGYSFWDNFFSDLGRTVTVVGRPNTASAVLFLLALTAAGLGLALYFLAAPRLFAQPQGRLARFRRLLAIVGSLFGTISALSFVGVAFTPANLYRGAHIWFVLAAFEAFPIAAACYALAVWLHPDYPRRYFWTYVVFALLLAGYVWLMFNGPARDSAAGIRVQVVGQKAIVYATIVCMLVQSYGAQQVWQAQQKTVLSGGEE